MQYKNILLKYNIVLEIVVVKNDMSKTSILLVGSGGGGIITLRSFF